VSAARIILAGASFIAGGCVRAVAARRRATPGGSVRLRWSAPGHNGAGFVGAVVRHEPALVCFAPCSAQGFDGIFDWVGISGNKLHGNGDGV